MVEEAAEVTEDTDTVAEDTGMEVEGDGDVEDGEVVVGEDGERVTVTQSCTTLIQSTLPNPLGRATTAATVGRDPSASAQFPRVPASSIQSPELASTSTPS
jgi:hypothetical protein